jgi:hypothetical protein
VWLRAEFKSTSFYPLRTVCPIFLSILCPFIKNPFAALPTGLAFSARQKSETSAYWEPRATRRASCNTKRHYWCALKTTSMRTVSNHRRQYTQIAGCSSLQDV